MTFLSSFKISSRLREVLQRFPMVILFALATTIGLIFLIDDVSGKIFRWPVSAFIGFLVMLNWSIVKEAYQLSIKVFRIGVGIIFLLLGLYFFLIPSDLDNNISCFWIFSVGLSIILHLLLSLVPFLKNFEKSAFVDYNIKIFVAWIQSAFYALTLFLAMSLALLALDQLFDIAISSLVYFRLFILITGLVQVAFFLSEFPENFHHEQTAINYSIFKIFISYVAIPITLIYGAILIAYIIRIIVFGHEMVEWVFVMCLWYFFIGILTYLFSLYFKNRIDNPIMLWFRKFFFLASIPQVILFVLSLVSNIYQSGLKDEFYLSVMIAFFVTLIVMVMIIPIEKDLRIFPGLLILLSIITFWGGPISICTLPYTSLQKKLILDLTESGLIKNGVILYDSSKVYSIKDSEFNNRVYYLGSRNKLNFLREFDQKRLLNEMDYAGSILSLVHQESMTQSEQYFSFSGNNEAYENISEFDLLLYMTQEFEEDKAESYVVRKNNELSIIVEDKVVWQFDIAADVYQLYTKKEKYPVLYKENEFYLAKILVKSASGSKVKDVVKIDDVQGFVLLKKKK